MEGQRARSEPTNAPLMPIAVGVFGFRLTTTARKGRITIPQVTGLRAWPHGVTAARLKGTTRVSDDAGHKIDQSCSEEETT